jgi:hypothetical protein
MCGRFTATFEFSEIRVPWNLDRCGCGRPLFVKARLVLKPLPAELMDAHDITPIVNSAKYDGPECIQPVSDDEIPRAGQLSLL